MLDDRERTKGEVRVDCEFGPDDWKALETAVCLVPELAIVALLLKRGARERNKYPLATSDELLALLPGDRIVVAGREVAKEDIVAYVTDDLFPVRNQRELAQAAYIAFNRCNAAMTWAAQAPPNAAGVLRRFRHVREATEAAATRMSHPGSPGMSKEV